MTKIKNALFATTFLAMGAAGISAAVAATQGTTGATSSGDLVVSMIIDNKLKVSNLADVALGTYAGANLTGSEPICVYFNQTANYRITIDSNDVPGTFEMFDGVANNIAYTMTYDDGLGASPVVAGTALVAQSTGGNDAATGADDDCVTHTADNGTIAFTATSAAITGNPNGTYSETIDITVAPDI